MDSNLVEAQQKILATIDHFKHELSSIRAGRANPALLEELPVLAYGERMKLMELATISAPQTTLLLVQVWDPSVTRDIEKAIRDSNLGLNPALDGQTFRVAIPPLTAERREEFIKITHAKAEEAKIAVRQIRQDQKETWVKAKEIGEIGEDELYRREKLLQDLVDNTNSRIEELLKAKEADLREI